LLSIAPEHSFWYPGSIDDCAQGLVVEQRHLAGLIKSLQYHDFIGCREEDLERDIPELERLATL